MKSAGSRNTNPSRRHVRALTFVSLSLGALIMAAVVIYYGFGRYGASNLADLNAVIDEPAGLPQTKAGQIEEIGILTADGEFRPLMSLERDAEFSTEGSFVEYSPPQSASPTEKNTVRNVDTVDISEATQSQGDELTATTPETEAKADVAALIDTYGPLYPGLQTHPKHWSDTWNTRSGGYTFGVVRRPDGFLSVSAEQGRARGTASDAIHIRIPSIEVDSPISNLGIIDLGDSSYYETPDRVVGRIPEMANPGELGNTWLFGHLESIIGGEGNVFHRLPEIPKLLSNGDPVYVNLLNAGGDEFLYQVTKTQVVHQDDLALYDVGDATVTLVACVPRLIYDHRILITGKLVGIKKAA